MMLLKQHNLLPRLQSCSPLNDAMHAGQGFVEDLCHAYVSMDTFSISVDMPSCCEHIPVVKPTFSIQRSHCVLACIVTTYDKMNDKWRFNYSSEL